MSASPIAADGKASFERLAARLAERARLLAQAHLAAARLEGRGDESRWRRADLVWPLFRKG